MARDVRGGGIRVDSLRPGLRVARHQVHQRLLHLQGTEDGTEDRQETRGQYQSVA